MTTILINKEEYAFMKNKIKELETKLHSVSIKTTVQEKLQEAMNARVRELNPNHNDRSMRREIVDDLKWGFRIRFIDIITEEQLPELMEYIKNWEPTNWMEKRENARKYLMKTRE